MVIWHLLTVSELVSTDRSERTIAYVRRETWIIEDGRLHDAGRKHNLVQWRVVVCLCDDELAKRSRM